MATKTDNPELSGPENERSARSAKRLRRRRFYVVSIWTAAIAVVLLCGAAWIGVKAATIRSELQAATTTLPSLKRDIAENNPGAATETVASLVQHTKAARDASNDPLWKAASVLPWLGPNLQAAREVAISADDAARLGAAPLVRAAQSLDWQALAPSADGMDLSALRSAGPQIQSAAHAVQESSRRLNTIKTDNLLPQISEPLLLAKSELSSFQEELNSAADASRLAPGMLGDVAPKRYLLLMQNNAESRATGGIPGAVAVLHVDKGQLRLESQTSAAALGTFVPPIATDAEQQAIFSGRVGKFMQDVNLTPDFPTTARTAQAMWEKRSGDQLDGVLSIDAVALSYILEATGPVKLTDPVVKELGTRLPSQLTSKNAVKTLLSDAYAEIDEPKLQDLYYASAAKDIFGAISSGTTDPKKLIDALGRGVEARRILLWSRNTDEQDTLAKYRLSGKVFGAEVSPAQFGIYFNDGTGAKMDYWLKRSAQVVKDCTRDGYREVSVRVTSTNTAAPDAATSLSPYVTGGGIFGVPAGTVQTNVTVYGPVQATVDTVLRDGVKVPFTAQRHGQRGVGTSTIRLAPGESTTLDFNFGHIVQHAEPELVVTPTTQDVKDVVLGPATSPCE